MSRHIIWIYKSRVASSNVQTLHEIYVLNYLTASKNATLVLSILSYVVYSFGTFREFLTTSSPKNTSVELRLNESKIYLSAKDDIYIQSHIQSQQRKQHDTYVWDKLKITVNTPQWFSFRTGWKKWKYLGLGCSSLLPLSTAS